MITLIGFPTDKNSSYLQGAALAPNAIMKEFYSDSRNKFSENSVNLGLDNLWKYNGCLDLDMLDNQNEYNLINSTIKNQLESNNYCISLGGDHSITFPIIDAYHHYFPNLNILHFDAHPDLYEDFDNNYYSHASPFARIMKNKLVNSLTQIGIRTMNDHQQSQAEKYNVKVLKMNDFNPEMNLDIKAPIYLSIDMDALDPAFAPGVSHAEPGGLSSRDIIKIISNLEGKIVGADIVEYNPIRDINNLTAITAAKLLKELMGKICNQ